MDSHEWNKILGSVLGTVLFVVMHIASQAIHYAPTYETGLQRSRRRSKDRDACRRCGACRRSAPDFDGAPMVDAMAGAAIAERCAACRLGQRRPEQDRAQSVRRRRTA